MDRPMNNAPSAANLLVDLAIFMAVFLRRGTRR
jgi:hypothetical protein